MCPGSTVGALGDTEHSISLSGHTLFSSQKAATQQGANLLLQWGGWGVGGGLGNNNHCTVRAPVTAPSSDYISFEHTHEPFLLVWERKSDEECLPVGGGGVCFHSGSRSSAASGTQAVGIRWFLSATGNQKYILW